MISEEPTYLIVCTRQEIHNNRDSIELNAKEISKIWCEMISQATRNVASSVSIRHGCKIVVKCTRYYEVRERLPKSATSQTLLDHLRAGKQMAIYVEDTDCCVYGEL
jgi:hypothetical protein